VDSPIMHINDVVDTPESLLRWRKQCWRDPEYVRDVLFDLQCSACSGIAQFPELLPECTAHLLAGENDLFGVIFKALKRGLRTGTEIAEYASVLGKPDQQGDIPALFGLPMSRPYARWAINRLKIIIAWQYRRELKARRPAA